MSAIMKLQRLTGARKLFLRSITTTPARTSKQREAVDTTLASHDHLQTISTSKGPELDALYQRLEVEVRGHDPAVLQSYEWYACKAAEHLGITLANKWVPPKHLLRRDTLKSVHIYKKHMVQYEARTYFRVMEFKHVTGSTADTYLEYIQRNLPEGVSMIVSKIGIWRIIGNLLALHDYKCPNEYSKIGK